MLRYQKLFEVSGGGGGETPCPNSESTDTLSKERKKVIKEIINGKIESNIECFKNKWGADKEVMLCLLTKNKGSNLTNYVSKDLMKSPEFLEELIGGNGHYLHCASKTLIQDKCLVLKAVKNYGLALQFASYHWKDKDVVEAAVRSDYRALKFADEELKKNMNLVLIAVNVNGFALEHAPHFCQNKDVVEIAVKNNYPAVQYAHETLKQDLDFMKKMLDINVETFYFASSKLRSNADYLKTRSDLIEKKKSRGKCILM